jgi:hypothetical protein
VVGITAGDEEAGERVGQVLGVRIGGIDVQVPQRGTDVAPVVDRPGEFPGAAAWLVALVLDPPTLPRPHGCPPPDRPVPE